MAILDPEKAAAVDPFSKNPGEYEPPFYATPGTEVTIKIESRDQEKAILAAYDYGIDALGPEGREIEVLFRISLM